MFQLISLAVLALSIQTSAPPGPNTLTAAEKAAGWQLLFDGRSLDGWRAYGKDTPPGAGWEVTDGTLRTVAKAKGSDIITTRSFTDFELSWEWRVMAPGGWSGGARTGAGLHCVATLGSPKVGAGPQIGTWQQTVDYVRLRNRGYALRRGALKRIETEQPSVAVSPVDVDLRDDELPRVLLGAPSWPGLHSAWVCPESTDAVTRACASCWA